MSRLRTIAVALVGVAFVATGIAIAVATQPTRSEGTTGGMILLALLAVVVGLWKIRGTLDSSANGPPAPWAEEGFATPAPERTDRKPPLSSDGLTRVVDAAGRTARESETVDEGLAVVRPVLRTALRDALVQGGESRSAAEAAIDDGRWTDDQVAASVLSAGVEPPTRSIRERLRAWLFPERVIRRRTGRAMRAVAEAANEALPAVPGQAAPRSVPVLQPRLEELRRGASGELQRAANPAAIARGPRSVGLRSETKRDERESEPGLGSKSGPESEPDLGSKPGSGTEPEDEPEPWGAAIDGSIDADRNRQRGSDE